MAVIWSARICPIGRRPSVTVQRATGPRCIGKRPVMTAQSRWFAGWRALPAWYGATSGPSRSIQASLSATSAVGCSGRSPSHGWHRPYAAWRGLQTEECANRASAIGSDAGRPDVPLGSIPLTHSSVSPLQILSAPCRTRLLRLPVIGTRRCSPIRQ